MTPLDDHLRTTLHTRADSLTPSPDPLGGIEARARGLRRRRVTATVAGAALAVSAIAVAVPSLRGGNTKPSQVATSSAGLLDPAHPWGFRGSISDASRASFQAAWQTKHPGSTLTLLFGQTYEPSGQEEAVFIASGPDGYRFGWSTTTAAGGVSSVDQPLGRAAGALPLGLAGDEGVRRLLIVAAPDSTIRSVDVALTELAPGVAVAPVEKHVHWTVQDRGGDQVAQGDAEPASYDQAPANLLSWPSRGTQDNSLLEPASAALAPSLNADPSQVLLYVLYTSDSAVMGQAWKRGDAQAHSFSYDKSGQVVFGPVTPTNPQVLAFLFAGTPTDVLVVIPRPGTGQVSYAPDTTSTLQPVADGRSDLNGVALIDRSPTATNDRLEVLDGDGNPDKPLYRGPVAPLLCGAKECG